MGINIRAKGQTGERDIVNMINEIYEEVYAELNLPLPCKANGELIPIAQRNQNQSAVGGADISNSCGYAIEVKRQEALAVNTWWNQCVASADELKKFPVLVFKQNRKKWRVMLYANPWRLFAAEQIFHPRVEITLEDFKTIFKEHALHYIRANGSAT